MLSSHNYEVMEVYYGGICAAIAQLGERQTEDLKVPGSIPGRGNFVFIYIFLSSNMTSFFL